MFKGSIGLLLSFVRRRIKTIKAHTTTYFNGCATVVDPTETFGSITGQLPLEGMTLNENHSGESTAMDLHEDVTVPTE
jgi:hypothetical protein